MVSNQRYISIFLIFVTTFILFQGLLLGRVVASNIHENRHARQDVLTASQSRSVTPPVHFDEAFSSPGLTDHSYVLLVTPSDSAYVSIVEEWASYSGKTVVRKGVMPEPGDYPLPDIILISPDMLRKSEPSLEWFLNRGTDVLFLSLPKPEKVERSSALMGLLGIKEIRQPEVSLAGVHLFSGFFLGGERIYREDDDGNGGEDHSLNLDVPWYVTRVKTKTYMRGILSDQDQAAAEAAGLKNEDMPSLIWSCHSLKGTAFAVCGDYFLNRKIGLGILSAVDYERKGYSLYSVVNAQVLSMIDFPVMADENEDLMHTTYGRGMDRFEADIIVPQIQALESRYGYRVSCFMAPKYDYDDPAEVGEDTIDYFLGILHDVQGELALSMRYKGDTTLAEKLAHDETYYLKEDSSYPINGAYADADSLPEVVQQLSAHRMWSRIHTISLSPTDGLPFLSYVSEHITAQQVTSDSLSHTHLQDLELIGLETALAYDNVSLPMSDTFWPADEEAQWQNMSRKATSNMTTYYAPFSAFDKVTVSESNSRIRGYLNRAFTVKRAGSVITLDMPEYDDTASFILRTHDEGIASIEGAAYKEIEANAYLITPQKKQTRITLRSERRSIVFPEEAY
jgi:hypothetical protein